MMRRSVARLVVCVEFVALFVIPVSTQVDGGWSAWTKIGECKAETCNATTGTVYVYRSCNEPYPQDGGSPCVGTRYEERQCKPNGYPCPVPGGWCPFEEISPCEGCRNPVIGGPYSIAKRLCKCPEPKYGGSCEYATETESRSCDDLPLCSDIRTQETGTTGPDINWESFTEPTVGDIAFVTTGPDIDWDDFNYDKK